MQIIKVPCIALCALILCTGVSQQQSAKDRRKQKTNFWGTLTKYTGKKEYHVENISISNITDQIDIFEKPDLPAGALANDPRKGTIIHIDFTEIAQIEVPNPEKVWFFKRNDRAEKKEYIEFVVYPRGGGKPNSYMIDLSRRLLCDEKSTGGPIEMDVPFNEIKQLVIEGYNARLEQTNGNGQTPAGCYVCPAVPVNGPASAAPAAENASQTQQ